MIINLEINDRVYNDIETYCNANNIEVQGYIIDIINEKHSINKYGDLNEIIPIVIEETTVKTKKKVKTKTEKMEDNVDKPIETVTTTSVSEEKEPTPTKTVVRKKRTLKTL